MDGQLLQEQIAFYRARAPEYDQSNATRDQLEAVRRTLRAMGPFENLLELACGTGLWTRELVNLGRAVTAIDASPEMLELNRRRVADARVSYVQADLFAWQPERDYDFVFAAFWLSHVPPDLMDTFLDKIRRAVRPGGTVFIADQCDDIRDEPEREREGIREIRKTSDGRIFGIVKVYYHPVLLAHRLGRFGFHASGQRVGESFFSILGHKT
jgi:demethylmenaquinone methyltransferase/2-methoxy-6-polyprenyl-1,4-benzoquinol methylase